MDLSGSPPLGLAHFTAIAVPPLELVSLAARTRYAAVGLRLYPAFPGAPFYEIPASSAASHEMQERLRGKGIRVYDIEFVTLSQGFAPSFPQAVQVVSEAGRANGGVLVDALHPSRTGGTREDVRQTPAHSCVMPSRNDHPPTRPSSRKRAQIACCQAAAHCRNRWVGSRLGSTRGQVP